MKLLTTSADQRLKHQGPGPSREVQEAQSEKSEGLRRRHSAFTAWLQTQGFFGPASQSEVGQEGGHRKGGFKKKQQECHWKRSKRIVQVLSNP